MTTTSLYTWQWQLQNAIRTPTELEQVLPLTEEEKSSLAHLGKEDALPLLLTPHVLSLINKENPYDPIRLQLIPRNSEFAFTNWDRRDPLGEEEREVVPHLVHRYPDRVLFLVTDRCASYCRYCTRKRWVGQGPTPSQSEHQQALRYIADRTQIKEVVISGGDPLMLSDGRLEYIFSSLRKIPHIEILRIHTRMLTFAPTRITPSFVDTLKVHQPIYIVTQFNHVNEISKEAEAALSSLIDAGIPVLNQSVLLKNINDSTEHLTALLRKLVYLRVRPYYLHQCDVIKGASHFRVPLKRALELMKSLRSHISGLCIPQLVVDIPGGLGKVPLLPNVIVEEKEGSITLKGFQGETADYPS